MNFFYSLTNALTCDDVVVGITMFLLLDLQKARTARSLCQVGNAHAGE
jgi:hypothetical protein